MAALVFGAYYLYQNFAASRTPYGNDPATTQNNPVDIGNSPFGEEMSGADDVSGSWTYTLQMPDGQTSGTLTLWGPSNDLQGMMSNVVRASESETLANVRMSGSDITFQIPSQEFGTITFNAVILGQSMNGTMNVSGMNPISFKATYTSQ